MALDDPRPLSEITVYAVNTLGTTSTGSRVSAPATVRGRIVEAGFMPSSLVASAMTMAVAIGVNGPTNTTTSNFTTIITSTLGTFGSTNLYEGAVASAIPPSPAFINRGDAIQWTTSGGNNSTIPITVYAVIRRAGVG